MNVGRRERGEIAKGADNSGNSQVKTLRPLLAFVSFASR